MCVIIPVIIYLHKKVEAREMKKYLISVLIILFVFSITGCSGDDQDKKDSTSNTTAKTTAKNSDTITNTSFIGVQITVRMDLNNNDAAVRQEYYKINELSWNGLSFSGSASYKAEIQRGTRQEVTEDVTISGKLSSDGKAIESVVIENTRDFIESSELVIDQKFEIVDIPLKDPDKSDDYVFYRREKPDDVTKILKVWSEKEPRLDDVTLETKIDEFMRHSQDLEIEVFFFK
jgi:transposase